LIEKLCVARDEEVGVYGFVFFHGSTWVSDIINDQLFWCPNTKNSAHENKTSIAVIKRRMIDSLATAEKDYTFRDRARKERLGFR